MRASPPTRPGRLVALGVAGALIFAACSGDDDAADDTADVADTAEQAALEEAEARAEAAEAAAEEAEAEVAALMTRVEDAEAAAEDAEAEAEEVTSTFEALVASETVRADTAETEVERFTDLFPIEVESTLDGIELEQEGVWNITWVEAYCDTFATCGTLPTVAQATFTRTEDDFLRVQVAGILDAGLFAIDGSLYAITDSETALPACPDGTPRDARITITVYANDIRIDADGTRSVTGLEGAITVDSRTEGDCPGGLVFYGVNLSRTG